MSVSLTVYLAYGVSYWLSAFDQTQQVTGFKTGLA